MNNLFTNCGECKYYVENQAERQAGICVRYPPTPHLVYQKHPEKDEPIQLTMSVRPPVAAQEFCGEGVPRMLI